MDLRLERQGALLALDRGDLCRRRVERALLVPERAEAGTTPTSMATAVTTARGSIQWLRLAITKL